MFRLSGQKLLVIAPHPDDEVIGCGGLIKKIKDSGGKVYVLYMTVGDTQDFSKKGFSSSEERLKEIKKVVKFLKIDGWDMAFLGNSYHLKLDLLGQKALMDKIERESKVSIEKIKPTIVAFPSPTSYNQDHRLVAQAAHAAPRPQPANHKHFVPLVLSYEETTDLWTLKQEAVNTFIPLTREDLSHKIKAVKLYQSQLRLGANLRSPHVVEILAKLRGAQIGQEYAEAFLSYRSILS